MEIKKRLLSIAIFLTIIGASIAYKEHQNNSQDIINEQTDDNEITIEEFIKENELEADPYLTYNMALEQVGITLDEFDIAYLSSLRDDARIVAVNSTIGHYNVVRLDTTDDYLIVIEDGKQPRFAEKEVIDDYTYDILRGMYVSKGLYEVNKEDTIPFGVFVEENNLTPAGFCLPNIGMCEASDNALRIIKAIYGQKLVDVIKEKGLPLPYYSYNSIYNSVEKNKTRKLSD